MVLVLLDRDGCLNKHSKNEKYITKVQSIEYYDDVQLFFDYLEKRGFKSAVVTNQQGVNLGFLTEMSIILMHKKLLEMTNYDEKDLKLFFCPHLSNTCECRKPKPKMLQDAIAEFEAQNETTFMIGDSITDYQAAVAANVNFIQINRSDSEVAAFANDIYIAKNLMECASYISSTLDKLF
jgi:D-glycero-D-manno-heptose 1,7-bisphosphate phosphatase